MERDLSDIAGTLKYGVFMGVNRKKAVQTYIHFGAVWALIVAAVVVVICVVWVYTDFLSADYFVVGLIIFPVLLSAFPALFLVACIRNERYRKEILLWLDDAVELEAYSTGIADLDSGVSKTMARIQVDFDFNGERLSRVSEGRMLGDKTSPDGYHAIWTDYADRKIRILYSPKYDQIIVLKD